MDTIVFTNGCFDIVHPGHIDLLERAKQLGTRLIVGINSDDSVKRIKGNGRPFLTANERRAILLGLKAVDEVRIFDEPTPELLIREIKPDVLVKGGDWSVDEIIGSDFVRQTGGKVFSLPLKDDFSSSKIVERIQAGGMKESAELKPLEPGDIAEASILEHISVLRKIVSDDLQIVYDCAETILQTFQRGNKVLICGNGGSAADAQHIAAEFVGRYETERRGLPAIALSTDTSAITAISNDYGFERVFARQVEALACEGDCLLAISTSGDSPNVSAAVMAARGKGCKVIGLTGGKGKKLASLSDLCIMIPASRTARIQEAHITLAHVICEIIDRKIEDEQY
jgi:D-sedoheptulose 7-phosphate isomerase